MNAASFSAAGAPFPPHSIARLLFSGMGGTGFFEFGPSRIVRSREVRFDNGPRPMGFGPRSDLFDEPLLSSDDDDEEDTFAGFLSQMRRVHSRTSTVRVPMPMGRYGTAGAAAAAAAAPSPPARSYAVNMGETNAGLAHNPLEIEDDSDDDDDEVEVVEVVTNLE